MVSFRLSLPVLLALLPATLAQLPSSAPECVARCFQAKINEAGQLAPNVQSGNLAGLCQTPAFINAWDQCLADNCVESSARAVRGEIADGFSERAERRGQADGTVAGTAGLQRRCFLGLYVQITRFTRLRTRLTLPPLAAVAQSASSSAASLQSSAASVAASASSAASSALASASTQTSFGAAASAASSVSSSLASVTSSLNSDVSSRCVHTLSLSPERST